MAGKLLYGLLFVLVLPGALLWWAIATESVVPLPVVRYAWAGYILIAAGLGLMLSGVTALVRHGKGWPMNPYPPPIYVSRGIYRYTSHPIYLGFVIAALGLALVSRSPSGIWLVTPMVALALTALVLGYERHDLRRRFGTEAIRKPLISLPEDSPDRPTAWGRASAYLLVLFPWAAAYEAVFTLGVPADAFDVRFAFERDWPVLQWSEAIYGGVYLLVLSAPLIVRCRRALRDFAMMGLISTAVVSLIYVTVPAISPPRPFEPTTFLGRALMFERSMSHTVAAFPAFHVIWAFIAAAAWATRSSAWGIAGWLWAILIAVSCVTTGMHAVADIIAATVVFGLLLRRRRIWETMRRAAETIANSWREWRWNGVRLINYGLYAAVAAAVGFWASTSLGGPDVFWQLVFVHVCGLVGAGLWAQQLEGSPKLARPFGYYGAVIGVIAAALIAGILDGNTVQLLALIAVVAPWMQAIGRLRCLVQGCCHGSEAPENVGIRYHDPRSRVCALADLQGVPLHPTPLYSIIANVAIGALLFRLWSLGASYGLIAGGYLMLAGVARFVEESYRGEPQTMIIGGLRIYQWLAILSFAFGYLLTIIPSADAPGLDVTFGLRALLAGALYGLLAGFAMGVDFPSSARRFARLAAP